MNKKVVTCSVIAALGGFLFGFDTVVISGAEQAIQRLWGLSAALLTLFFPKMVEAFQPWPILAFFCAMMVLQLVWVRLLVPETKGVPPGQMQKKLGIA